MTPTPKSYFPYEEYRPGQEYLINEVYSAVKERAHLTVEAASGFGKTVSVLAGVLPVAMREDLKVVWLAKTHREHERVVDELSWYVIPYPGYEESCASRR